VQHQTELSAQRVRRRKSRRGRDLVHRQDGRLQKFTGTVDADLEQPAFGATPDLFTEATRQRPLAAAGVGGKIDQAKRFAKPVKGPGSRRRKADP
jgi:hypothetical protein